MSSPSHNIQHIKPLLFSNFHALFIKINLCPFLVLNRLDYKNSPDFIDDAEEQDQDPIRASEVGDVREFPFTSLQV